MNGTLKNKNTLQYCELNFLLWRINFEWGTYGKHNKGLLTYIHPYQMSNYHLVNVIKHISIDKYIISVLNKYTLKKFLGENPLVVLPNVYGNKYFLYEYLLRRDLKITIPENEKKRI